MLLSSSKFIRTMMDDFVDQDWFEESAEDEVVKQHPMVVVEHQNHQQPSPLHISVENGFGCFHSVPIHGQTDFLELNVPVDEMFFGNTEVAAPLLTELDTQQQKMTNSDNNFSCSNVKAVQEVQQKQSPTESHRQNNQIQFGQGGAQLVQNGPSGTAQPRECFYADWPPTTSSNFSTSQPLSNTVGKILKNGREEQRMLQRHEQQQQRWTTAPLLAENGIVHQQLPYQQHNEYGGGQQTTKFSTENDFPMTRIIVRDQSVGQLTQHSSFGGVCSSDGIALQQNAIFHNTYSTSCNLNSQNVSTLSEQCQQQQQQIVITEEQLQQQHFSQRVANPSEFRLTESSLNSTKRPTKTKPSASNNRKGTSSSQQCVQEAGGTNLDQIATMLFSNSNLATVQFDAQRAVEFGQVLEQTKLLREQEEQGADVGEQLRACEARIAELVQNAMAQQQGNGTTTTKGATTAAKKRSKAKKKAPAKAEQQQNANAQTLGQMAQPTQQMISDGPAGSIASNCHQPMVLLTTSPEVICQPSVVCSNAAVANPSDKFKLYSSQHSEFPSSSYHLPFPPHVSSTSSIPNIAVSSISLANSRKNSSPLSTEVISLQTKEQKAPIATEKSTETIQQIKKQQESEQQIAQEKEKERLKKERKKLAEERERLAKEKEREKRRHTKLSDAFDALRSSIPSLDYKTPFSDRMDCVKRLLPFGLLAETELSAEFQQKFDGELQRHSDFLNERMEAIKERFQSVFFTESLCEMKEQRNLLLRLDIEFEKAQLQKAIEANGASLSFPIASSSALLDWECDDNWDRNRYREISPFVDPPENIELEEADEVTSDEMDKAAAITQTEEQKEIGLDVAAAPCAKVATIRIPLRPYLAVEKSLKVEQRAKGHSPNIGEQKGGEELALYAHDNNNKEGKNGFGKPPNDLQFPHRISSDELSVVPSVVSSENSQPFQPKTTLPLFPSVHLIPPATEISSKKILCHNLAPSSSNCDNIVMNIDENSVVKSLANTSRLTPGKTTENEWSDLQESSKELREGIERKKEEERAELNMEPVKLKIKLDKKKNDTISKMEERNGEEKEENEEEKKTNKCENEENKEKGGKLEKKRLKALKKEKKREIKLEKERAKKERHRERGEAFAGGEEPKDEANSSTAHFQNGERPPPSLKISLRRLACWRGTDNEISEYSSNSKDLSTVPNGETVNIANINSGTTTMNDDAGIRPEIAGDSLKLRISKLILKRNGHGEDSIGEAKSEEHRKKGRKRKKREEKSQQPQKEEGEGEESPRKVPRLKIKIGNGCNGEHAEQEETAGGRCASAGQDSGRERPPSKSEDKREQREESKHRQTNTLNPSDLFGDNNTNQIRFSPCCSEESDDDELRVRTNELFTKLCQD